MYSVQIVKLLVWTSDVPNVLDLTLQISLNDVIGFGLDNFRFLVYDYTVFGSVAFAMWFLSHFHFSFILYGAFQFYFILITANVYRHLEDALIKFHVTVPHLWPFDTHFL